MLVPQEKEHPWQDSNLQPPDPWSGALPLSHTDTLRKECHLLGLNQGPSDLQSDALPTELKRHDDDDVASLFRRRGEVAEWSKALRSGRSLFGGVGSNPTLTNISQTAPRQQQKGFRHRELNPGLLGEGQVF